MARKKNAAKKAVKETPKVRGFFRLQVENPDGTLAGDSGWCENIITNQGYLKYLANNIGKNASSSQVGFIALGTGGIPLATDTTLTGEIMASTQRTAVTYTNLSSKSAQFTATFASSNSFLTASSNLSHCNL
jgi:hypothetical protein